MDYFIPIFGVGFFVVSKLCSYRLLLSPSIGTILKTT